MSLFGDGFVACPICGTALPRAADKLEHWVSHTFGITTGSGAHGYTWICSCGPATMYWQENQQAGAGLAIHMLELHFIAV